MDEIKRYDPTIQGDYRGGEIAEMREYKKGECVMYTDHLAATAQLRERVRVLEEACQTSLANYMRMLESERTVGEPRVGDDEHEAIRVLTKALHPSA